MVNKCAVAGLVFGALASIIAVLEGTLKAFVDVFIAEESGDDAALSCKIAGLGVYTTEYDSSCLSPERLASSRVPSEQFTAPTTSFKLLFPAQENFVAEVLPVNDEVLSLFEGADVLVGPVLAEVTDLEFSSCQQYMTDAQTGLEDLFGVLNDQFLPLLVPLIIGEAATAVSGGITQIGAVTNVAPGAANAFTNIFASTFDFAKGALVAAGQAGVCPVVGKALTDAFDATDYTCLQNGYAGFATTVTGALPGFFNDLAGVMGGCAAAPPAVGFACYASIQSNFGDNGLLAPVTGTFCDDFSICTQDIQKFQAFGQLAGFVGQLAALVAANGADPASLLSLAQGLGGMQLFGAAFAPTLAGLGQAGTNAQIGALLASATTTVGATFPTTFTAPYVPCELLQIAQAGLGLDLDAIPNLGQVCSFGSFFDGAAALAAATGDDLAALVGQLAFLYDICRDNPAFSSPQDCDLFYPSLFMNAAYQSEMQEGFLTLSPANTSPVFDLGVLACADDEVDKEKIGEAQTFLGASIALYFVAALFGGFSMAVERHSKTFALAFATILGIVAVALNFGALLTVRSAPVYESVGEPAVEDEPVYKEGLVVKLALMAALLQVVSCVCYTVAACVNHRSIDREEAAGDNTAKEVEVEKAELAVAEKAEA